MLETDTAGLTVLHYAARGGRPDLVLALLLAGALPNAPTHGLHVRLPPYFHTPIDTMTKD